MAEAHLDFCRVHVHIHFLARQIHKQKHRRKYIRRQNVAVGLMDGVKQQTVPHQSPIRENVDAVAVGTLHFRARGESANDKLGCARGLVERRLGYGCANRRGGSRNFDHLVQHLPAKKLVHALA